VLLLDEPFDDLDAATQESLSLDLRRAIAETDVAVAVVTHDLRRALLLADRVAVLRNGRVAQCDAREQVLKRPVDPDVARLVGMSNLIAGEVKRGVVEFSAQLRVPAPPGCASGSQVWGGIRPEHVEVEDGSGAGVSIGEARVRHVVSDGVACTVTFDWEGTELRTHLVAGRGPAGTIAPGDAVTLAIRPENVHVMKRREEPPSAASMRDGAGAHGPGRPA
jgi:ABC-type sulfate/molybdate transport systems ATPase subunit